ncbi:MAG: type II secretion system protein M [Deltaproteobacteria bacterium]|nr:type II secretion system protein M [Deltaproteobacteria bacterium]
MRLRAREKALLVLGGGVLLLILYYLLLLSPALSRSKMLDVRIVKSRTDLKEMETLRNRWEGLQALRSEASRRLAAGERGFSLLTFLEDVCREIGIESRIQYLKPSLSQEAEGAKSAEGIEISLEGINTAELVRLLYRIDHSGQLLQWGRVRIQGGTRREGGRDGAPGGRQETLKVLLQINSYKRDE